MAATLDTIDRADDMAEAAERAIETAQALASALEQQCEPGPGPTPTAPTTAPGAQPVAPPAGAGPSPSRPVETSIRVSVGLLDHLMNLAGEMVLARNQMMQALQSSQQSDLNRIASRLDQFTSELQEAIMQTRMQPIETVFNKFPRIVRDLSGKLDKQCELVLNGRNVELDKSIIEAIADPLTHLIRNAVDHGVEMPDQRIARGKRANGTILLDAVRLIFHPGLSTAQRVTDVSGRGVGIDVVRTNIERLGGTVDIETQIGVGTTVSIKLPLTPAIIPSLVVRCAGERFAFPQVSIHSLVRIKPNEVARRLERVKNAEVLRLRGAPLPLVRLATVLGVSPDDAGATDAPPEPSAGASHATSGRALNIVVESGHLRHGLIVDGRFLQSICKLENELLVVLDVDTALSVEVTPR